MFIDGKPVCKVNNNSYSTHQIAPGKHTFSVQYSGDEAKEKAAARSVEIDVQPGKKYILKAAIEKKFFTTELYLEEITEATWERYQKGLKEDNCL